jgi:cytochrome c-type biogenesis protein CcsB
MPVVFILMLSSSMLPRKIEPLSPVLQSYWLGIHTVFAFIGDAAFAMAFGIGLMYLIQEHYVKSKHLGGLFRRLPSLQILDEINYRLITIGFPFLTLAIITGALWAESAWGSYWRWDPKEVWSLITWFIYALVLHVRLTVGWRGKRAAILSIIGFCVVLFTFFGVNLLLKGLHSF